MRVFGITGSIGMGKSTVARMLRRLRMPVHDADAAVHQLMAGGGIAVAPVAARFPGVVVDGAVDRKALGREVFGNPAALADLEAILHPLVRVAETQFLARARQQRRRRVALDVPLLFERRGQRGIDVVLVVSAPAFLQRARVLRRPGMTIETFRRILSQQMPDADKRRRADRVIPSGLGLAVTHRALTRAIHA